MQMLTILVVGDDRHIADLIVAVLSDNVYQVCAVHDGEAALKFLETSRPDLILSDITMPVMDGKELYTRLRADPKYRAIPILLMSATSGVFTEGVLRGASLIEKPFSIEELVSMVKRKLNDRKLGS